MYFIAVSPPTQYTFVWQYIDEYSTAGAVMAPIAGGFLRFTETSQTQSKSQSCLYYQAYDQCHLSTQA